MAGQECENPGTSMMGEIREETEVSFPSEE